MRDQRQAALKALRHQVESAHSMMKPGQRYSLWLSEGKYVLVLPEGGQPRPAAKRIGAYSCDVALEDLVSDVFDLE